LLKINDLTYRYKIQNTENLYSFSLNAKKAEIVGIIGASGNGKSTLLDLISGFLEPICGEIICDGTDLIGLSPEDRPMTILFQNHNLFEHLSVEKNIILGVKGETNKQEVYKILKLVGLEGYENKIAKTLSGGQQQRVALARSLLRNKPILLLDEPFTGLDFDTRMLMLKLVKDITRAKKLYTIMVTHEISDCDKIADRVYEVKNGKLTLL
jgi:thiamine transport system ATP-binding protein